jgi:hypothetical protein
LATMPTVVAELLQRAAVLPKTERLLLVHALVEALAREGETEVVMPAEAEMWSPYEAHDAASAMLRYLIETPEK